MSASYNYYEILGLNEKATAAEIKAAYRKLAMQYHPDRNPSPDAHQQFVAINAAHETLGDPLKKRLYDLGRQVGQVIPGRTRRRSATRPGEPPISPEEMRRRYWASPVGQRKKRELQKEENIFRKISFVFRMISLPIMAFMLLLLFDSLFPQSFPNQSVTYVKARARKDGHVVRYDHKYRLGTHEAWVKHRFKDCLQDGDQVDVWKGRVFGLVTSIRLSEGPCEYVLKYEKIELEKDQIFDPAVSLFSGPGILIYLVLIFCGFMWVRRKNGPLVSGFGFVSLLLSVVIYLLFRNLLP